MKIPHSQIIQKVLIILLHRVQIVLKYLAHYFLKVLDDLNDDDFVELASVRNGVLRTRPTTSDYNILNDELARRTFAESGNYTVKPFSVSVRESLNDNIGNNGVYGDGQSTEARI